MILDIEDYEKEKYIAFVDVLGFKNLVNKIEKKETYDSSFHNTDKDTFGTINKFYEQVSIENYLEKDNEDLQITCISDCLIISATSYSNILRFLFYLQNNLLCQDYDNNKLLTRGYLTKGKFIHDTSKNLIFGEAYQRAYLAEENEAINPRIIVDPKILNQFQHNNNDKFEIT
jgi:hypothetical protein